MGTRTILFAGTVLFAAACGGGGHDVEPAVVAGGGISDPGIDGEVNFFVIDEDTDDPIQGATVYVGTEVEGETDADGLFVADGVSGPQDITIVATDYTTQTWFGVDGANVTIPIGLAEPETEVSTANVTGTIAGWSAMEAPAGEYLVAFVGYSATRIDSDPANDLQQPPGDLNQCVKSPGGNEPCTWNLLTRTGPQVIFAMIGHADFAAASPTLTLTGFAWVDGIDVDEGDTMSGVTLDIADAADVEVADISLPSAPMGTDTVAALARLDVGDEGYIQFPVAGFELPNVTIESIAFPTASAIDGATLDLVAIATTTVAGSQAASFQIDQDVETLDGASVSTFLRLPQNLTTDGTTFSLDAIDGADLHTLGVQDEGVGVWGGAIFDDRLEVTLPDVVGLPDGPLVFTAGGIEIVGVELDLQDFSLDTVMEQDLRMSADGVEFTN